MADNSDWYARKLAQARGGQPSPAQVAQPPQYPPVAPPLAPGQLPAHLAPYAQQPTPQMYAQPAPQGTPQAPVQPQGGTPQNFYSYNAETGAQVADDGHVALLYNAVAQTGGSQLVKSNSAQCPNCFKDTLFTIKEGAVFSKAAGGRVEAQQCGSCGWPKVQAGSTGGALASARGGGGPAKPSRQLPANHRVTVAVEGGGYATFEPPTGAR